MTTTKDIDTNTNDHIPTWEMVAKTAFNNYLITKKLSSWAQALAMAARDDFNLTFAQASDIIGVAREVVWNNYRKACMLSDKSLKK